MYVRIMSGSALSEAVAAVRAAVDSAVGAEVDLLGRADLVDALDELETVWCQLPGLRHRLLARLQVEATAKEMGARSWAQVLSVRWRISTAEAGRRLGEAALLGPRQSITGQNPGACQMVCVSPVNGRIAGRDDRQGQGFIAG